MQVRIVTIPYVDGTGGFDDRFLRDLVVKNEVSRIESQFFVKDGVPHWSFFCCYIPGGDVEIKRDKSRQDWREIIRKEDWPLFNRFRDWRKELAHKHGIPPFLVLTNRQLAEIMERKCSTLSALSEIDGIGPRRIEKYGKAVLEILQGADDGQ